MAQVPSWQRHHVVRIVIAIVLSIVTGTVVGFGLDRLLFNWKALNDNLGWFLILLPTCLIYRAFWKAFDPQKMSDLSAGSDSATQIWPRPAMWSWACFMAGAKFANGLDDGRNLKSAGVRAVTFFVICYAAIVAFSWCMSPGKWEREA
jgi:hypothetical protein